ncbi:MAG: hypothetical protein ACOC0N_06705, partial [Chroococcales cyanobacterium]
MQPLHRRINPKTFVITVEQIAKHLGISPKRILNWEKWQSVLWVHIEGKGGYFISYRKLEQWIAACRLLMRGCSQIAALDQVWMAIASELQRYTQEAIDRLQDF